MNRLHRPFTWCITFFILIGLFYVPPQETPSYLEFLPKHLVRHEATPPEVQVLPNRPFTFTNSNAQRPTQTPEELERTALKISTHFIKELPNLKKGDTFPTPIPTDSSIVAEIHRQQSLSSSIQTLSGSLSDGGYFALANFNGAINANFRTGDGQFFQIRESSSGSVFVEVDPLLYPPCDGQVTPSADLLNQSSADETSLEQDTFTFQPTAKDYPQAANRIDVLVAFNTEARDESGGYNGIISAIYLAIEETNQAYANSGLNNTVLNLVYAYEMDRQPNAIDGSELEVWADNSDGIQDEIHTLRSQYGADICSVWFGSSTTGAGIGYLQLLNFSNSSTGFNLCNLQAATGNYTFAHEVGHNLGCQHDADNASYKLPTENLTQDDLNNGYASLYPSYAYGWHLETNLKRTIMAYDKSPGYPRIPYFSNPAIAYNGESTGENIPETVTGLHQFTGASASLNITRNNSQRIAETASNTTTWQAESPGIFLISPLGGETFTYGQSVDIIWNSRGIGDFVDLILVNGENQNLIASNTPNDGFFDWTIPNETILTNTYQIKIIPTDTNTPTTQSDTFSISEEQFVNFGQLPPFFTTPSQSDRPFSVITTNTAPDGQFILQSPNLNTDETASLTAIVDLTPGTISFQWQSDLIDQVSFPVTDQFFKFFINEQEIAQITGSTPWTTVNHTINTAGTYQLTWVVNRDLYTLNGANLNYNAALDNVSLPLAPQALSLTPGNDYAVNIGSMPSLANSAEATIAFWFKPHAFSSVGQLFTVNGYNGDLQLAYHTNSLSVIFQTRLETYPVNLTLGQWYHLSLIIDTANSVTADTIQLVLDGQPLTPQAENDYSGFLLPNSGTYRIGTDIASTSYHPEATIDQFHIFNRALSTTENAQLLFNDVNPEADGLLLQYLMDGESLYLSDSARWLESFSSNPKYPGVTTIRNYSTTVATDFPSTNRLLTDTVSTTAMSQGLQLSGNLPPDEWCTYFALNNRTESTPDSVVGDTAYRTEKVWSLYQTGSLSTLTLTFDLTELSEAFNKGIQSSDYQLLYRPDGVSEFQAITTGNSLNNDLVNFTLTSPIANGFYALALKASALDFSGLVTSIEGNTLYWQINRDLGFTNYQLEQFDGIEWIQLASIDADTQNPTMRYQQNLTNDQWPTRMIITTEQGSTQTFTVGQTTVESVVYELTAGWTLLSIPGNLSEVSELAEQGLTVWSWQNGQYYQPDYLNAGQGLWVYSPNNGQLTTNQLIPERVTIPLEFSWTLFGPISQTLTDRSFIFEWNGADYQPISKTNPLMDQKAYWIFPAVRTDLIFEKN